MQDYYSWYEDNREEFDTDDECREAYLIAYYEKTGRYLNDD